MTDRFVEPLFYEGGDGEGDGRGDKPTRKAHGTLEDRVLPANHGQYQAGLIVGRAASFIQIAPALIFSFKIAGVGLTAANLPLAFGVFVGILVLSQIIGFGIEVLSMVAARKNENGAGFCAGFGSGLNSIGRLFGLRRLASRLSA
ncbi:MAG: hypothetical protein JO126_05670 [Alphaproteobacteria bacterium]|nr:hypothetical protein [Alphaproteobacteria bacterium]